MRIAIAAIVAAVIVFVWGFISWGLVGIWSSHVRSMPNHERLVPAILAELPETGAYFFPPLTIMPAPASPEDAQREMERFEREHRAGPIGMVLLRREGAEPMAPMVFVWGLALNLANGLLLAAVLTALARRGAGFGERFAAGLAICVFAVVSTWGSNWNWFLLPGGYTAALMGDHLIGWILATLAVALLVADTRTVRTIRSA